MTEVTVLESIRQEAEENRLELDRLLRRNGNQLDRIDGFLALTPDELRSLPQDSVAPWIAAIVVIWTYDGDDSAAGLFLGSSPVTRHANVYVRELTQASAVLDSLRALVREGAGGPDQAFDNRPIST